MKGIMIPICLVAIWSNGAAAQATMGTPVNLQMSESLADATVETCAEKYDPALVYDNVVVCKISATPRVTVSNDSNFAFCFGSIANSKVSVMRRRTDVVNRITMKPFDAILSIKTEAGNNTVYEDERITDKMFNAAIPGELYANSKSNYFNKLTMSSTGVGADITGNLTKSILLEFTCIFNLR